MRIIVDVMSGDHAPEELIKGAAMAAAEYDVDITVVGNRELIRKIAFVNGYDISRLTIEHAKSVIEMEDSPLDVVRKKRDCSMAVGLRMLAEGKGDAFVSAGNTGALVTGATLIVRRIKGIQRAAIATVLPFPVPVLLMDSGANLQVTSEHLEQFAFMGAKYMEKIYGIKYPRVGLLNNGTEYNKGGTLQVETYALLREQRKLHFIGNVEGKDIPFNVCDVLVTDGFVGNILLKFTEGMGKFMLHTLKDVFTANFVTLLSAAAMKGQLTKLKKQFDASEHGGAPLLGVSKPVIKAHGNSDAYAIQNAIFQAMNFVATGINAEIGAFAADQEAERYRLSEQEQMEAAYAAADAEEAEGAAPAEDTPEDAPSTTPTEDKDTRKKEKGRFGRKKQQN